MSGEVVANPPRNSMPRRQNLYGSRLPSVTINWYEGPLLWTVQPSFLAPDDALAVAESIRNVVEG